MSLQLIQLDTAPNQTWQLTVTVNGTPKTFFVVLRYNEVAGYWVMTIKDSQNMVLRDSIPLLTGLNIQKQFNYLGLGSLYIINVSRVADDHPNNRNLGSDFQMLWGDLVA